MWNVKNRIRPFPFFKISVFFPFFVRFFLKKINNKKRIAFLKNGKLPENCRKIAGKKTQISKNGNGRIRFSNFSFFLNFRFFSVFFPVFTFLEIFKNLKKKILSPFFIRFLSVFWKIYFFAVFFSNPFF